VGYVLTHFRLPEEALLAAAATGPLGAFGHAPVSALVGGVVVGFVLNWITIPVFVRVFRLIPVRGEAAPARPARV
jgi:hypothetical protein